MFEHWSTTADAPTVNLSYLASFIIPWNDLIILQGLIMLLVFVIAWKCVASPEKCMVWGSIALLLFILFNGIIEVYFFLLVLFIFVGYEYIEEWISDDENNPSPKYETDT